MTTAQPNTETTLAVLLAEYTQLKDEQRARIGFRDNFIYVNLAAVAAIGYAAFQQHVAQFLLLIPLACFVLGWTYLSNDRMITALGHYFRDTLGPQLTALAAYRDVLGWEHELPQDRRRAERKRIQLAVDLSAFCAPPIAAIVLVVRAGTSLGYRHGPWTGVMLALATSATVLLAWHFVSYADVALPRIRLRRHSRRPHPVPPDRAQHEPGS